MDPISLNAAGTQAPVTSLSKKVDAVTVKPTGDSINAQTAANEANSYYKYDTMELSREYVGYRMKSENATVGSDTDQQSSNIDQKSSRIPTDDEEENREKKETRSQTADADEPDDEKVSSNQLGGYTSSELKGLVLSGKITVATYNAEMKSRQDDKQPAEPQQPKKPVLGQSGRKAANSLF
ncbi:hypothetical protein [Acetobacterium malicum]|uniref:hypothetical protein n=1 Tax=Acetobacterium malicum TaxID=52692 RepID=UPI00040FE93B|nr:hypothetical protein [Acetobacterium dehalogenans]